MCVCVCMYVYVCMCVCIVVNVINIIQPSGVMEVTIHSAIDCSKHEVL